MQHDDKPLVNARPKTSYGYCRKCLKSKHLGQRTRTGSGPDPRPSRGPPQGLLHGRGSCPPYRAGAVHGATVAGGETDRRHARPGHRPPRPAAHRPLGTCQVSPGRTGRPPERRRAGAGGWPDGRARITRHENATYAGPGLPCGAAGTGTPEPPVGRVADGARGSRTTRCPGAALHPRKNGSRRLPSTLTTTASAPKGINAYARC
jgi:hypothetical protein